MPRVRAFTFCGALALLAFLEPGLVLAQRAGCHGRSQTAAAGARDEAEVAVAVRQCEAMYFHAETGAWFRVDCLVPDKFAQLGVWTWVDVPTIGRVQAWITQVLAAPRTTPPSFPTPVPQPSATPPAAADAASAQRDEPGTAVIHLILPSRARLMVEGQNVAAVPGYQQIRVPDLARDGIYEYRLVAEIASDAGVETRTRVVRLMADREITVDMAAAEGVISAPGRPRAAHR